jgi:hypothetical protein
VHNKSFSTLGAEDGGLTDAEKKRRKKLQQQEERVNFF